MSYFPMFVELKGRPCLVVGGGRVALRKVEVLKEFGAKITVVAPECIPEIEKMAVEVSESGEKNTMAAAMWESEISMEQGITMVQREFQQQDIDGMELVVAATDDKELNHRIAQECRRQRIPINAVDQTEDCSFIFPAYLKQGEVVSAFSSGGQSPVITQYLKKEVLPLMTEHLGEMAECLGALRDTVKATVEPEAARKKFYQEVLALGLENEIVPAQEDIIQILKKYQRR